MMRSRYFFNSSIIRQNLRQHGWIGILYALGLLLVLPLQMFMGNNTEMDRIELDSLFKVGFAGQALLLITCPIVAGLFLTRYLQAKSPSDLWHSLPLRREHLLTANLASGLLLLLLPVWLTAGVSAALGSWSGNRYLFEGADIWNWALVASILTLFLFCFTQFVGIFIGQTILQGVVTCILLVLPVVISQLISLHLSIFLYGYPNQSSVENFVSNLSPFMNLIDLEAASFSRLELGTYLGLSFLFIGLSYLLYRVRDSEQAGQAVAFRYMNPFFKAGVMLCAGLLCGAYFSMEMNRQPGWVVGGYVVGALFGYAAAQMVIRKSWNILSRKSSLEWLLYTALLGLLLYIPASGLTGYEKRVPSAEEISGVYAGSNYQLYTPEDSPEKGMGRTPYTGEQPYSADPDYIEAVRKLHLIVAAVQPENSLKSAYNYTQSTRLTLAYKLDNGREMIREYLVPLTGFEPELKAVMETESYKREEYALDWLDKDIEKIRLSTNEKAVVLSSSAEIAEFKEILTQEILSMSYEDQISNRVNEGGIEVTLASEEATTSSHVRVSYSSSHYYSWKTSYQELARWLEQKGYAAKVRVSPEDILSAELMKDDYSAQLSDGNQNNVDKHMELARSQKRAVVTEDKGMIADILARQRYYDYNRSDYLVLLKYKAGYENYVTLAEEDLTPGLRALIPQ
ncbi:hypothetical protein GCM10010912_31260 [Paenibacillus albidus]|uniref:DUF6449 domain-containing protein n=1 Tax=Paenibacillus albidus TaxID=2041023 RepID=A0A917CC33_9BACL|nr:DUF6449 domain-containing protein [Paenibacillus albidus]GGF83833.1 hypothetical protein GCM10010912_31260 [Paenibacillus albidus]